MARKWVLSAEHRARELIHGIMLATLCLKTEGATVAERQLWKQRAAAARRRLEALYSNGLDRNFRNPAAASAAGQFTLSLGGVPSPATVLIPQGDQDQPPPPPA